MVITLTGPNDFLSSLELKQLVTDFSSKHDEMGLERLDGSEVSLERISEALNSLPFLATKKLVVISEGSANKSFSEQVEGLLTNLPEATDVILYEPRLDKRTGYYKYLKKATDFREFNELDSQGLSRWLSDHAKSRGGSLSQTDGRYLIERLGPNQRLLVSELDKLLLYSPSVSRQAIDELTEPTPQSSIFELLDAAFNGQTVKVLKLYKEQRAQKVEPPQIIAMLTWQLYVLSLVKVAKERTNAQIAQQARLSPYTINKSAQIAKRLSLSQLKRLISDLVSLDVKLKTKTIDSDEAVQYFLLNISQPS